MSAGSGKGRVLVVEDDPHVREAVERALRFEGYDVHTAVDGNDALLRIDELDPRRRSCSTCSCPGTDGLAVCRILRDRGNHTPVLMLTARHEVSDRVAGLDAGADDYLVKPFALDELFARVRALLRRSSVTDGDDHADRRRSRPRPDAPPGVARRARARAHQDRVRSPRAVDVQRRASSSRARSIYERIWGYDFETSSKSLDVYIGYLRRKTEVDGAPGSSTRSAASGTRSGTP